MKKILGQILILVVLLSAFWGVRAQPVKACIEVPDSISLSFAYNDGTSRSFNAGYGFNGNETQLVEYVDGVQPGATLVTLNSSYVGNPGSAHTYNATNTLSSSPDINGNLGTVFALVYDSCNGTSAQINVYLRQSNPGGQVGVGSQSASSPLQVFGQPVVNLSAVSSSSSGSSINVVTGESFSLNWTSAGTEDQNPVPGDQTCTTSWAGAQGESGSLSLTAPSTPQSLTYSVTCSGPLGSTSAPSTVTVNVGAAPDFSLVCNPLSQTIAPSGSGSVSVTASATNGFASPVTYSASAVSVPAGVTPVPSVTFIPATPVTPPSTVIGAISVPAGAPANTTYRVTVTGTAGALSKTCITDVSTPGNPAAFIALRDASNFGGPLAFGDPNSTEVSNQTMTLSSGSTGTNIQWDSTGANTCLLSSRDSTSPGVWGAWSTVSISENDGRQRQQTFPGPQQNPPTGGRQYRVTCENGSLSSSAYATTYPYVSSGGFSVTPPTCSVASQDIEQGSAGSLTALTTITSPFAQNINWSYSLTPNFTATTLPTLSSSSTNPSTPPYPPNPSYLVVVNTSTATSVGAYTLTITAASAAYPNSSCTATVNVLPAYVPPVDSLSVLNTVACGNIQLSWAFTAPESQIDGFRIYRNGAALADVTPTSARSYVDSSVVSGNSYTYYIRTYKGGLESAQVPLVPGSVSPQSCTAALTTTDKDIVAVNGVAVSPAPVPCNGETDPVSVPGQSERTFKPGDVLRFRICVQNTGANPAQDLVVNDNGMQNLSYVGNPSAGVTVAQTTPYPIFNINAPISGGALFSFQFDAAVASLPAGVAGQFGRFRNAGNVQGTDAVSGDPLSASFATPSFLFGNSAGGRQEVAP